MATAFDHRPVLVGHVLKFLNPRPGQVVFDATVGLGGHALEIVKRLAPGGRYIGVDVDAEMIAVAQQRLATATDVEIRLERATYLEMNSLLDRLSLATVDHILIDLGANSAQIDDAARGFSFDRDGPLDMRFDRSQKRTAADLVNALSERELSDLFYEHGQESLSRKIAKRICEVRRNGRIMTTRALASAVESAYTAAGAGEGRRTSPSTRVFQALRIAVNDELANLSRFLEQVTPRLKPDGVFVAIAFHSLEDALVKRFLRDAKEAGTMRILEPSPATPDEAERRDNPRCRSAKLRAARRMTA